MPGDGRSSDRPIMLKNRHCTGLGPSSTERNGFRGDSDQTQTPGLSMSALVQGNQVDVERFAVFGFFTHIGLVANTMQLTIA